MSHQWVHDTMLALSQYSSFYVRLCVYHLLFTRSFNSYPAKSTRCSFDLLMVADPCSLEVICIENIQWDLVEA